MKIISVILLTLALAAGGFLYFNRQQQREAANRPAERPTTATVESRDINFAVSAAGDIGPADQVSVRPEVNGKIDELPVDIGDKVKKDQLLCRLDDRDLMTERDQRQIEIDGAKLQLTKAERSYARNKQLFDDQLLPLETYDDSRTDRDLAKNSLDRATQALRQVEDKLLKTKMLAPFDCTVLTRPVSLGQTVSGSAGFNSGTEIMTIANLNNMIVNAHVNQADVTRLSVNQVVDIQVDSVAGLKMKGVVERIAPQATVKSNIKGFAARILLKELDPRVRPGMTANISIPIATAENVLAVPLAAVFTENGERFVYLVRKPAGDDEDDSPLEKRAVRIGVSDNFFAEVQGGVIAGDVVSLVPPGSDSNGTGAKPGGAASGNGFRPAGAPASTGGSKKLSSLPGSGGARSGTAGIGR